MRHLLLILALCQSMRMKDLAVVMISLKPVALNVRLIINRL